MKRLNATYLPWEARQHRVRRLLDRTRWLQMMMAFVLLFIVYGMISSAVTRHRVRSTQALIEQIRVSVREFRVLNGRCPLSVKELTRSPRPLSQKWSREPVDAWGRSFWLQCPSQHNLWDVEIASSGPDGNWASLDLVR